MTSGDELEGLRALAEYLEVEVHDDRISLEAGDWQVRGDLVCGEEITTFNLRLDRLESSDPTVEAPREEVFSLVRFSVEGVGDRVAKSIRLARELQVGDPTFDDRVYIESDLEDDEDDECELVAKARWRGGRHHPVRSGFRGM